MRSTRRTNEKLNPKSADAMLQYLVILLSDDSTSYCHLTSIPSPRGEGRLMPLDTLKQGIRFGMMENLMIQFIYPDYDIPQEYKDTVETIDHSKIVSFSVKSQAKEEADVLIANGWENIPEESEVPIVIRTNKKDFFAQYKEIVPLLTNAPRVNLAFTDIDTWTDEDLDIYKTVLFELGKELEQLFVEGKAPQLNLLIDRMLLTQMNNCGAGDTTITLVPNGKFYVCPAFYYENEKDCIGDLEHGLDIKNKQLYKLEYAPICRHCDAWQCKRCIWLNRKLTLEVNTPSREQCVMAHLERNASRDLLLAIRKHGTFMPDTEITEIDYLDPFDKKDEW